MLRANFWQETNNTILHTKFSEQFSTRNHKIQCAQTDLNDRLLTTHTEIQGYYFTRGVAFGTLIKGSGVRPYKQIYNFFIHNRLVLLVISLEQFILFSGITFVTYSQTQAVAVLDGPKPKSIGGISLGTGQVKLNRTMVNSYGYSL